MANNAGISFPQGTPLYSIQSWKSAVSNEQTVSDIFTNSGNYFTLQTGNISHIFNTLHVYLGVTAVQENQELVLYAVPGLCDYSQHMNDEFTRYQESKKQTQEETGLEIRVNSKLETIGLYNADIQSKFNGNYTPEEQQLIESIIAWNTPKTRNAWINSLYNQNKPMVLALDINISDFVMAEAHTCYLALKQVEGGYQMDLVIESTTTGKFLNIETDASGVTSLRDMARPVPPFGQDVYTQSSEQFGILGLV